MQGMLSKSEGMKLNLSIKQFASIISADSTMLDLSGRIDEVAYDSRLIIRSEGVVFFALKGAFQNGDQFILDAYQKGVRHFVVDKLPAKKEQNAVYFVVSNTLFALQNLAAFHRGRITYPILAVGGAIGKTTIKEWIYHLLSPALNVHRSPKSFNSQLGVALSLLELPLSGDLAIIEVAISKPGEMERLEEIIAPKFCVITSTIGYHRHEFESDLAYREALKILSKNCTWLIDQEFENISLPDSYATLAQAIPFKDPLRNFNARMALYCALKFHSCSKEAIAELPSLANRMELIDGIKGSTLINDSYTLDLNAFAASLIFLNDSANQRPTLVCCFLDKSQDQLKTQILDLFKTHAIDHFYIWSEMPQELPPIENHLVLIKGKQELTEVLLASWRLKSHSTTVTYDLSALHHNLRQFQKALRPETKILAMVKAQAYGAGLIQLAEQLEKSGVNYLGVAYADEGVRLREAGIRLPILVMNAEPIGFERCVKHELEPAIYSLEHLDAFIRVLIAQHKQAYPVHIKIDSGMHRLGFAPSEIQQVLQTISAQPEVLIKSVYSHLACADDPKNPMNEMQISIFNGCCAQFTKNLSYHFDKHLLNSEGSVSFTDAQFDMVRLGIGLFGIHHDPSFESKLKPIFSWKTQISQIKQLKKGACVGYSCTSPLVEDMQVAIIPVGYADGFDRNLSNGAGGVYIDGRYCPTIGRVCMDMIIVSAPHARLDSEVEIIGPNQSLASFAKKAQTIPYEVLTGISPRVQRIYTNN